jgi:hypothetical protein
MGKFEPPISELARCGAGTEGLLVQSEPASQTELIEPQAGTPGPGFSDQMPDSDLKNN